jgi:uncharacterized membrane protein
MLAAYFAAMSAFTDVEIEFVNNHRLGRLAEAGRRLGAPFRFAPAWIRIRPHRIVTMGINGAQLESSARNVTYHR